MEFALPPHVVDLAQRTRTFVDREVIPLESHPTEDGLAPDVLARSRDRAREAGVYGPQIPKAYGGLGLSLTEIVPVFEAAGRSLLGPLVLNCSAPDEGNIHTLELA